MTDRALDCSHHNAKNMGGGVYIVTANMQQAKDAGAVGVTVRSNYGTRPDTTAPEHNRRADAASLPRAFYYYHLSRQDPVRQANVGFIQAGKVAGVRGFADLEESAGNDGADPVFPRYSEDYYQHVTLGLITCDNLTNRITGIYSSQQWLDRWFTKSQQQRWVEQKRWGWWAHWSDPGPGIPWVPAGWKGLPVEWCQWQDKTGPWPGFQGQVDQSALWPGLSWESIFTLVDPVEPPPPNTTLTAINIQAQAIRKLVL